LIAILCKVVHFRLAVPNFTIRPGTNYSAAVLRCRRIYGIEYSVEFTKLSDSLQGAGHTGESGILGYGVTGFGFRRMTIDLIGKKTSIQVLPNNRIDKGLL